MARPDTTPDGTVLGDSPGNAAPEGRGDISSRDAALRPWTAPAQLADRLGTTPASVVIGALAVIAAAAGAWWAFATPAPAPEVVLPAATELAVPIPSAVDPEPAIWVHVDGAVPAPGVHELAAGARVIDAIGAAGGLDADADRSRLNLALVLADQQRVWVPRIGEEIPAVAGVADSAVPQSSGEGPVDVNHADAATLESLPGVGPALAAAIVEHRDRHGAFAVLDDLTDVAGIGPAKLEQIRPFARA